MQFLPKTRIITRNYLLPVFKSHKMSSLQTNLNPTFAKLYGMTKRDKSPEFLSILQNQCNYLNLNLSKLKFVHVAGTKGKGTTCAFTESILRGQGLKTGFFTSPHLVSPCERIRINGKPISEEKFEEYFDFCYENLHNSGKEEHLRELSFFKMTFLMSLKCFLEEKVDVAIIEVGIGGRFDFTNLITPEVCGITLIEFDHVITLGNTISSIAHHKAGIIKQNVPVVTFKEQRPDAIEQFELEAKVQNAPLLFAPPLEYYDTNLRKIGVPGKHQRQNASIAVAMCNIFMRKWNGEEIDYTDENLFAQKPGKFQFIENFAHSLQNTYWPGRSHKVAISVGPNCPPLKLYLDGCHTVVSIAACVSWFLEKKEKPGHVQSTLIFNLSHGRNAEEIFRAIAALEHFAPFDYCIFTNFDTLLHPPAEKQSPAQQKELLAAYRKVFSNSDAQIASSIPDAIKIVIDRAKGSPTINHKVLVCGSFYLVGGVLECMIKDGLMRPLFT